MSDAIEYLENEANLLGCIIFISMRDRIDHGFPNSKAEIHTGILVQTELFASVDAERFGIIHAIEIGLEQCIHGSRHDFVKGYQNEGDLTTKRINAARIGREWLPRAPAWTTTRRPPRSIDG